MATPDPAVLAELTAQCRSSSRPQGVIFLGQAQLQDGGLEGLEKIFEMFDAPGNGTLQVGSRGAADDG